MSDNTNEIMVEAPYEPMKVWTTVPPGLERDNEQVAIYAIGSLKETLGLNDQQWRRVLAYHSDKASEPRLTAQRLPRRYSGPAYPEPSFGSSSDSDLHSMRTSRAVQEPYPPDDTEPA